MRIDDRTGNGARSESGARLRGGKGGEGDRSIVPRGPDEVEGARELAGRLGLEFVELSEVEVDPRAAGLVDRQVLRRHTALPVGFGDGKLVVAMRDPTDLHAREDLVMLSGYDVRPVVADGEDIGLTSNRVFAAAEEVTGLLAGAKAGDEGARGGVVELGGATVGEGPVVRLVGSILQRAIVAGASDVHLEPGAGETGVRYRVDGVLRRVMTVPGGLQDGLVARIKVLADLDIAERRVPQDGRLSVKLGSQRAEVRVATLPTVFGEKVVLRLLDTSSVEADLRRLGFEPAMLREYEKVFRRPYGTIFVTGPTGSGKSTTLYATLGEIDSGEKNIVTVEDPVEYRMPGVCQIQVNPKVGLGFASGLRSVLRSDPDVVMIGEIRDRETARTSIEAALTGHLVLATLHTNNAPAAVTRLTDMGVEPFLTASAVDCVIAQRLARRLCERCKRPATPDRRVPGLADLPTREDAAFCEPVGCGRCGETGYRGRVGVYELMVIDAEMRELIVDRVPTRRLDRAAEDAGMTRLRQDGLAKAARGITSVEEVLRTVV